MCLDGTLPGYHFLEGFDSGADNWLIHLEVYSINSILYTNSWLEDSASVTKLNPSINVTWESTDLQRGEKGKKKKKKVNSSAFLVPQLFISFWAICLKKKVHLN